MKPVILAVDDDSIMLNMYEATLGGLCRIYGVSSGEEAFQFLQAGPRPDLVLLDIMMPGMTGYEVCQKIRENPLYSHLRVILVSAKSMVEERLQGYDVGADDYITKPFEESELLSKVNVFLRLRNIEEVDKIKRNVLLLLSHEMRTPLNGIVGFSQLLQQSPILGEEEKEFVDLILKCGQNLLDLSEKSILLNDLCSGNIRVNKQRIKLTQLVSECQYKLITQAEQKQLSFHIQSGVDIEIDGDPILLSHAFEVVLDNALKFARHGTVIDVTFNPVGSRVQVHIANEGDPILDEHLNDIFDAFFVQHIEHHHRGHGLSLVTARQIITAHGGTLFVKNQSKGPVFIFDLQ